MHKTFPSVTGTQTKTKFDITGLFVRLSKEIQKLDEESRIMTIEKICAGSNHKSLVTYHNDFSIDILTKIHNYSKVLTALELCINQDAEIKPAQETINKAFDSELEQLYKNELDQLQNKLNNENLENQKLVNTISERENELVDLRDQLTKKRVEILIVNHKYDSEEQKITLTRHHYQVPEIVNDLTARNSNGYSEFLYLYGAPGCGKTMMFEHLAQALNVPLYPVQGGPTVTEGKIVGYNNIATGSFIPGLAYKAYKDGGLLCIDEICACDAMVITGACNALENKFYTFGNNETIERHKDFYLVVADNTKGTGSTRGFIRNKIDASTLNRFTMHEIFYDEHIEHDISIQMTGNIEWSTYCHRVRQYCNEYCAGTIYITTRAIRRGAAFIKQGKSTAEQIAEKSIFQLIDNDVKANILQNCGKFSI